MEGIQQDFYATQVISRLVSIQIHDCHDEIDALHNKKEDNQYQYKVNVTIGMLWDSLIRIAVYFRKALLYYRSCREMTSLLKY